MEDAYVKGVEFAIAEVAYYLKEMSSAALRKVCIPIPPYAFPGMAHSYDVEARARAAGISCERVTEVIMKELYG